MRSNAAASDAKSSRRPAQSAGVDAAAEASAAQIASTTEGPVSQRVDNSGNRPAVSDASAAGKSAACTTDAANTTEERSLHRSTGDMPTGTSPASSSATPARVLLVCLVVGAALFFAAYVYLTDRSLQETAEAAQSTVAFARQSIQRNEENISNSRTKSITAVWEKLEELDNRFDVTDEDSRAAIEAYLDKMNLDTVLLLDESRQVVRSVGDEGVGDAVAGALAGVGGLDDVFAYPAKSYLSRLTLGEDAYDVAACSTTALDDAILVGAKRVERGDVDNGQSMFNAMFDSYVFGMDGHVAVADEDSVLASNSADLLACEREAFDARLTLTGDRSLHGLSRGEFDGAACYGLTTTSNGYDVLVWFPKSSVMAQRNVLLACGFVLYLLVVLAVLVVRVNVQNAKLRREHEYLESLERANAAKTDFLRRMSHDVRTPINGIRGMLAIGDHYAQDMDKQAECRAKMWEASSFLLELVNSALDMNKLESGQMHFETKPFDLRRAVESVVDVLQVQAQNAGVELTSQVDVEHSHVLGSSLHLRQVLQNLGSNAVKYNRTGGHVHISCQELGLAEGRVNVRFVCEDTGIGMSEEFQQRAFEAFAQEDTAARSSYRGTGLGLAISKEIVEQLGGTIQLESAKGQGTTFTIELAFDLDPAAQAQGAPAETVRDASLEGLRVLLAEDNELNAEIAVFMLEQQGASVDVAQNGQEALEMFRASLNGHYDVVLMDMMMPVMDGASAAKAIRLLARSDAKTVPIIAVTANAFSDDREHCAASGMNAHVAKPLNADELIAAIHESRR